jgi:hypothetical protein
MRNVEWPMNVTTTFAALVDGGSICRWSMRVGHGVRRDSNIRGTAVSGCNGGPVGLKNRWPSK